MKNVVIQGCGRSGTSILGKLFEYLPECRYFFESQLPSISEYISETPKTPIAAKVPKGGDYLTPGLACDMDELKSITTEFKIIWIVRNPLDTICSLKPGIEDNWSHNPKPPQYKSLVNELWYVKCAYHWEYINNIGYQNALKYGDVLIVRYEDLISNTENTVSEILKHVDSNIDVKDLIEYIKKITNKVKDSYQAKYQVHWFRKDHKKRIGRFRENMNQRERNEALDITRDTAKLFGYKYIQILNQTFIRKSS